MRADLLDAQAAVDWAISQFPTFEEKVGAWRKNAYSVRIETDPQSGKKAYYVTLGAIPPLINAAAGSILHDIRTSLDMLAVALAERNGHSAPKDVYFPICEDLRAFLDTRRGGGKEKIKRLSTADQAAIEGLKPYKGGNDLLYALHHLDITSKHRRLIHIDKFPRGISIAPKDGSGVGIGTVEINRAWRSFEDQAPVVWTAPHIADCDIDIGIFVAFDEGGAVEGEQVIASLRKFAGLANSIIRLFDSP